MIRQAARGIAHGALLLFATLLPVFTVPGAFQPAADYAFAHPIQGQQPSREANSERLGRVVGRVVRAHDGSPLYKAIVTLEPEGRDGSSANVRTNRAGEFDFHGVTPGRYAVRATRAGHVQQPSDKPGGERHIVTVEPTRPTTPVEIRMMGAGVISGRATDDDGDPIEGLVVQALRVRFEPGGKATSAVVRSTVTDDLGGYRLSGLIPGNYHVRVVRQEGVSIGGPVSTSAYLSRFYPGASTRDGAARIEVTPGGEAPGIDLAVHTGSTFTIRGHVVDRTPQSPGRQYTVGYLVGGSLAMQLLDDDMAFTLSGVEPGEFMLVATASGRGLAEVRGYAAVTVGDADVSTVIELGRASDVRGEVTTTDGTVLPASLKVSLVPEAGNLVGGSGDVKSGAFAIRHVAEGAYRFALEGGAAQLYLKEARCAGTDYALGVFQVTGGQVEDCRLTIASDVSSVSGLVAHEKSPAADAVVILVPTDRERRRNPRHTITGRTDASGSFVLDGVIPGTYLAFAVPYAEDGRYYESGWPERNRERALQVTVASASSLTVALSLTSRQ